MSAPTIEELVDIGLGDGEEDLCDDAAAATDEDLRFDHIVGVLEGIVMDPAFRTTHEGFCRTHCAVFDSSDENKLEYTTIFQRYTELTETYIERRLVAEIEGFSMAEFMGMLESRPDEISGDLFDLLLGFGDFDEFKSLMLSYKEQFGLTGASVMDFSPIVTHLDVVESVSSAAGEPPALAAGFAGLSLSGFAQTAGSDSAQASQSRGQAAGEGGTRVAATSGSSTFERPA